MSQYVAQPVARNILGVPVDALTMSQALDVVEQTIAEGGRSLISVVNAAKLVNMSRDSYLDAAVRSADVILADGMSVVWASRLLRRPVPERVTGIDLMFGMLERGNDRGWRVYCLGASEEVSRTVAENMARDYPGVHMVGRRDGYFPEAQRADVAEDIAAARPDILLVAMTSPRKERFLADFSERMGVAVCHGVGGSFDVYAGKVQRAPELWQRWGLEWFYRVVQEPRRMWRRYLVTNSLFGGMVLREMLRSSLVGRGLTYLRSLTTNLGRSGRSRRARRSSLG